MRKTKKLFAWLVAGVMAVSLLPGTALAAEDTQNSGNVMGICTCEVLCTDDNVNTECPVCGTEGANLELCKGLGGDKDIEQNNISTMLPDSGSVVAKVGINEFSSLADAVNAITTADNKTGTVEIIEDIELSEHIIIPNGVNITFVDDGVPHTITMASSSDDQRSTAAFVVEKGGSLTIDGANLTFTRQAYSGSITGMISCHGQLILESGTFDFNGQNLVWGTNTNSASAIIHVWGSDAVFIMNGGIIQNASLSTNTGGVQVSSNARFILNNGIIQNITGGGSARSGAVLVYAPDTSYYLGKGTAYFEMNGGTIQNNTGYRGAGVHVVGQSYNYRATVIMNGGTIQENSCSSVTSQLAGGAGIYIEGNAEVTMYGGNILGNTSIGGVGGGVCTIDGYTTNFPDPSAPGAWPIETYSQYYPAAFTMLGGTISGNKATASGETGTVQGDGGCGGGVYCASNEVTLRGGRIEGNQADSQGGGVYIGSIPYELTIYNAVVKGNTASILGGGIWACPTGDTEVFVTNGVGVFGNSSYGAGDDVASVKSPEGGYVLTLSNRILGGGQVQWYADGGLADDGSVLGNPDDSPRYDPEGDAQPFVQIENSSEPYALKAVVSEAAQALAESNAELFICNNSAARGGGIGTNGSIVMGERDNEYTLRATKDWADADESLKTNVTVYLKVGNTVLDAVTLSAENGWTADFTQLQDPATLSDGLFYGVVENPIPEHFEPAYSEAIIDATAHLITITVTNSRQATGGLTVSKTVSGSAADETKEFDFTITLDDTSISGVYGDMEFENGIAKFTLKHGEMITASDLPAGVGYTVTESGNQGYTTTSTGESGIIMSGQNSEVIFYNHRDNSIETDPDRPTEPTPPPLIPSDPDDVIIVDEEEIEIEDSEESVISVTEAENILYDGMSGTGTAVVIAVILTASATVAAIMLKKKVNK